MVPFGGINYEVRIDLLDGITGMQYWWERVHSFHFPHPLGRSVSSSWISIAVVGRSLSVGLVTIPILEAVDYAVDGNYQRNNIILILHRPDSSIVIAV
jgi:hypothetical protein